MALGNWEAGLGMGRAEEGSRWVKEVVADVLGRGSRELARVWCQEPSLGTQRAC